MIKKNNTISAKQLAASPSVSDKTIERDMEKLKDENKLKRLGGGKTGHWEVLGIDDSNIEN